MTYDLWLTVSDVKVRQMPPKPFRERAKKISADRTAEKHTDELLPFKSSVLQPD